MKGDCVSKNFVIKICNMVPSTLSSRMELLVMNLVQLLKAIDLHKRPFAYVEPMFNIEAHRNMLCSTLSYVFFFLMHGGCLPASITHKRPDQSEVSVPGELKFIEGQQPYVQ